MPTLQQIRYYRGVVLPPIAKFHRAQRDEAHENIKKEFFDGKSTTKFDFEEFEGRLKIIRETYSKKGVWIPQPNESSLPPNF